MPETTVAESVQLLSDHQARGLMRSLAQSRQWWVLPIVSEATIDLAAAIERTHYAGASSGDFVLMVGPVPTIFARKRRMPAAALALLLTELRPASEWSDGQWRETLAGQDILVALSHEEDDAETLVRLMAWHDWLVAA